MLTGPPGEKGERGKRGPKGIIQYNIILLFGTYLPTIHIAIYNIYNCILLYILSNINYI